MYGWNDVLSRCDGFDWDKGNTFKSWLKHRVNFIEAEEVFFNQPLIIAQDFHHSQKESRLYALGKTDAGRLIFVSLTVRKNLIRIISARDMSRKEKEAYKEHEKENHPKV